MSRAASILLGLLFVGLGLGTVGTEITTGLALIGALFIGDRRRMGLLLPPVLALGAALLLSAPGGGPGAWREVLGRLWPLTPLLIVPALAVQRDPRSEWLGLLAACLPALWGVGQALLGQVGTGPFSHHLTLGYALLAPFSVAVARRRWPFVAVIGLGIASSGGSGPLLAAVVTGVGVRFLAPAWSLGGGLAAALALVAAGLRLGREDMFERAVLWSSGAWLALDRAAGVGTGNFRDEAAIVQATLEPGFYFPIHAHDTALQWAALVGLGGWIALCWLVVELWQRTDRAGRALLAGLMVGGLTQDVLGDLEVARAATVWLAWGVLGAARPADSPALDEPLTKDAVP